MKTIKAHIESNKQGFYSVYTEDDLPFGLIGEGKTVEGAKADFLKVYEEMRAAHRARTGLDLPATFMFVMDASAFLRHYKSVLPLAGLSRLTGVNKAQLSQYVCGTRRPSPKTQDKIKKAVKAFAEELSRSLA